MIFGFKILTIPHFQPEILQKQGYLVKQKRDLFKQEIELFQESHDVATFQQMILGSEILSLSQDIVKIDLPTGCPKKNGDLERF